MKKIGLLFITLLSLFKGVSQDNTFYHYGLEEGLSQESVRVIMKDKEGFVWIATQDGLNRFDGNHFKIYKKESNNPHSISGNYINCLLDDDNKIWIATANNGLCYYDKEQDYFTSVGQRKANCTDLAKDKNGNIYATYLDYGLSVFSMKNDSIHEDNKTFRKLKDSKLKTISITPNNKLLIGSVYGDLFLTDRNKETFEILTLSLNRKFNTINSILPEQNEIWLGTDFGLFLYNYSNKTFQPVTFGDEDKKQSIVVNAVVKVEDSFFLGTDNGLFIAHDLNQNSYSFETVTHYKGDQNTNNSITSNRVYDIVFDQDILWVGTNKLDVISLRPPVFKTINESSQPALENDFVFSILKTSDYTFIGTRHGINCIDNFGKSTLITKENTNNALAYNVIRGLTRDSNNNLWIATTKGISIIDLSNFNPQKPQVTSIYSDPDNQNSLSHNNTRNVYVDHNNKIWIATFGGGLNLFTGNLNRKEYSFKRFRFETNSKSISSDFTYNISQDATHTYWIATKNGLNRLSFSKSDTYSHPSFSVFTTENSELKTNAILSTFHDLEGNIWVGSQDGFYKYDTSNFVYYGEKQGLTNHVIYNILEAKDHNLWLSTNSGLFLFNKKEEHFTNFSVKEGLQSSEFNLGAAYNDHNILYFGGVKGVNYFNPDEIQQLYYESHLLFTSLKIKGKEVSPLTNQKISKKNITKTTKITLNYNDFPTYLSFSDLYYNKVKSSDFVYKLLPNDSEWNELNDRKEIQFLNLSSGTYTLLVQGKSNSKLWKKPPLTLQITVTPAWHKSYWAYLLYTLLGMGLLRLFYHFQLEKKMKYREVQRLQEINDLKTKLYANITHEFRTPITVISGMAETLKERLNTSEEKLTNPLNLIEKNAKNLLNLVNQILDLAKLDKGKLSLNLKQNNIVSHINYITENYRSFAKDNGTDLTFYNENGEIIMDYDADKISNMVENLISNAIKFCREDGKVIVHLSRKDSNFVLKIKDNGIGIPEENLPFLFDRFYQADNTTDSNKEGTGIGLALVQDLVHLMHGNISVESVLGKGTSFTITLPITNQAELQQTTPISNTEKQLAPITSKISRSEEALPIALVVEDNKDVATYILMCLEEHYQTLYAENGKKGVALAIAHTPDVIISDIMMPVMDGYELLEILKNDEKTNHIPIILLTAKVEQQDKISGFSAGADAYLTKPFHKEELLVRADKLIELRQILQQKYTQASSLVVKPKHQITTKNDAFINKIVSLISSNLDNSKFDSSQLAQALHLSESQLYRKLKALTNTSTAIYIRKVRLQKAKTLLEETNKTVSEICYETGFNDPGWFSKSFKQEFGYPPSDNR